MTHEIQVRSYAKVNYTLDVLNLRQDGFHSIASVMQSVSLSDELVVARCEGAGIEVVCDSPDVPSDASNLAARAAAAVLDAAGRSDGLRITLRKRIPAQAGLGGGSSNAAYAMRAANELLGLGMSPARLADLAPTLGSDVPFFLRGGTAVVRGRGERVAELPDGPPLWFVIVKPDVSVSTAAAYSALDAVPARQSARSTGAMQGLLETGDAGRVIARMTNDFEQVVIPDHLPVALLCDDLMMARASNVRLCGSGSAVFGVVETCEDAEAVAARMRRKYQGVHVCRALTRAEALNTEEWGTGRQ